MSVFAVKRDCLTRMVREFVDKQTTASVGLRRLRVAALAGAFGWALND